MLKSVEHKTVYNHGTWPVNKEEVFWKWWCPYILCGANSLCFPEKTWNYHNQSTYVYFLWDLSLTDRYYHQNINILYIPMVTIYFSIVIIFVIQIIVPGCRLHPSRDSQRLIKHACPRKELLSSPASTSSKPHNVILDGD